MDSLPLNTPLLSTSLYVKKATYNEGLTSNWFTGILPEGERLRKLASELNVSEYDYFELLKTVGCECAGAVQIFEHDKKAHQDPSYIHISKSDLKNRLLNNQTLIRSEGEPYRMSIGGFQDKILVAIKGSEFYIPDNGAMSTHILKPELSDYKGMVESEAWAITVASFAAKAANVEVINFDELPVLCVERFDREITNDELKRVHKEDFCQAMGLPVYNKYANEAEEKGDDPTFKKAVELIDKYSAKPLEELKELARQMITNICLGNYDAHAKNYSFLHDKNSNISVSPMYDVVPIAEVEPKTKYLSLRINHKILSGEVCREDIIKEITSWGLTENIAEQELNRTLNNLKNGIIRANKKYNNAAKLHAKLTLNRIKNLA